MNRTELSIVMLAFNSRNYIRLAIESMLMQSFTDFELIIIDDGSTDGTAEIIHSFDDRRIQTVFNNRNMGIAHCRNMGLKRAKGEFISFFDSDDIAHPEKYRLQLEFLRANSDYALVGSSVIIVNELNEETERWQLTMPHKKLLPWMSFRNCFVTSSIVFRSEEISRIAFRFPEGLEIGEDYLLWWKLLQGSRGYIMPDYLISYRRHPQSIMSRNAAKTRDFDKEVYSLILQDIGIEAGEEELLMHLQLKEKKVVHSIRELKDLSHWLLKIASAMIFSPQYDRKEVALVILDRWLKGSLKTGRNRWLLLGGIFYLRFYFDLARIIARKRNVVGSFLQKQSNREKLF
jgi:glycosyltransferase involved in cell wall biosynthesis